MMIIKNITSTIFIALLVFNVSVHIAVAQSIEVSDARSLQDAILDANDGRYTEIVIAGDIHLDDGAIILPALKNIGGPYVIRGKNGRQVTITGNGDQGLFRSIVNFAGGEVTFENVNFSGANKTNPAGPSYGGVFEGGSEFTTLHFIGPVTFDNNVITGTGSTTSDIYSGGGAIGNVKGTYGSEQTFAGTGTVAFTNNMARMYDVGAGTRQINSNGGAILYCNQTFTNIGDVVFRGNEAHTYMTATTTPGGSQGGAIFDGRQYYYNTGNVYFENNVAYLSGTNIQQSASGGAITAGNFIFRNLGDVYFRNNSAIAGGTAGSAQGGALYQPIMLFENIGDVYFTNNIAKNETTVSGRANGGAICENAWGGQTFQGTGNVYFQGNMTSNFGGAYYGSGSNTGVWDSIKGLTLAPQGTGKVIFENNWQNVTDFNDPGNGGERNAVYLRSNASDSRTISMVWLNPALDAQVLFYDSIQSEEGTNVYAHNANHQIIQNGPGTTRLWGDSKYYAQTIVKDGVFEIMNGASYGAVNGRYGSSNDMGHQFTISGGWLGIEIDPFGTDHGTLVTKSFTNSGGKIWVGNVSQFDAGTTGKIYEEVVTCQTSPVNLAGMTVDNQLMRATLVDQSDGTIDLHVDNIRNIADVFGSEYELADSQRLTSTLSDSMRIMYDRIYHLGVITDEFLDPYRNMTGGNVLEGAHAYWETSRMFEKAMHSRWPDDLHYVQNNFDDMYRGNNSHVPRNTWGRFTQNWSVQDADGVAAGYDYSPFAFAFGRDLTDGPRQFGIAAQYGHGLAKSGEMNWTHTKVDTAILGLYGGRYSKHHYFKANAQVGVGWNKEDTYYAAAGERTRASYHSTSFGGSFELGRHFYWGKSTTPFRMTPHIGMDYLFVGSESFDESGDPNMSRHFDRLNYNIGEIPFGVRFAKTWYRNHARFNQITPSLDLAYARSVLDNAPMTTACFLANPADPWTAVGSRMGRDAFRMSLALDAKFRRNWDFNLSYDLETRTNYTSQQLAANIVWTR